MLTEEVVCLKFKQLSLFIIIFLIIFTIIGFGCSHTDVESPLPNPDESDEKDPGWNGGMKDSPSYEIDSFYNLTEVPKLKKLFVNTTFIKEITVNRVPYLHGYSEDGFYAAFIYYVNNEVEGYLIQIYNTLSGLVSYSIFVPDTEKIIESTEFALAEEVLEEVYKINVTADRLNWTDIMEYNDSSGSLVFQKETFEGHVFLSITEENPQRKWLILADKYLNFGSKRVNIFTIPGNPDLVTFLFQQNLFADKEFMEYTPIFIDLSKLTETNSEQGMNIEADRWLYGGFVFIYNQWNTGTPRGFLALSEDSNIKKIENGVYADSVDQWIYLDPSGKMKWYGNSQGIYDRFGKPVKEFKHSYYYRVSVFYTFARDSLEYLIIDQFDKDTDKLIRTIEFKWDKEKDELLPVRDFIKMMN